MHFKPFSYKLVDIPPQKLHEHNEEADEECHQKQWQETPEHKSIKPFQ